MPMNSGLYTVAQDALTTHKVCHYPFLQIKKQLERKGTEWNRGKWGICSGAVMTGPKREGDSETEQVGLSDNLDGMVGLEWGGGGVGTDT